MTVFGTGASLDTHALYVGGTYGLTPAANGGTVIRRLGKCAPVRVGICDQLGAPSQGGVGRATPARHGAGNEGKNMRFVRTLALPVLLGCASLAWAVPSASAVEVVTESSGVHCSAITENFGSPEVAGGCPIRGTATDFELGGAFGVMVTCDLTFEGRMNEAGAMIGTWAQNGCETGAATPCTDAFDRHPNTGPLSGSGSFSTTMNICMVAFGLTNRCVSHLAYINEYVSHNYALSMTHVSKCGNVVNSLQGNISFVNDAAHPKVEIR